MKIEVIYLDSKAGHELSLSLLLATPHPSLSCFRSDSLAKVMTPLECHAKQSYTVADPTCEIDMCMFDLKFDAIGSRPPLDAEV